MAPPADDDAGGAKEDACGVHISAPTHARLMNKPSSDALTQQDRCLSTPVLQNLSMHMLWEGCNNANGGGDTSVGRP